MKQFRLLRPDEIECRVQKCTFKGVTILLYKTARTDADLLDETVGPANWENDFKLVDGVLYGGIGVRFPGNDFLVWKWDAGTESNTEAEKGRASDAFKRAGFKHGIGRELYSAPFIYIKASSGINIKDTERTDRNGKPIYACYDSFDLKAIEYDQAERISYLEIAIEGKTVYTYGKRSGAAAKNASVKPPETQSEPVPAASPIPASPEPEKPLSEPVPSSRPIWECTECKKGIMPYMHNGKPVSIREHAALSEKKFGTLLCLDCIKKRKGE